MSDPSGTLAGMLANLDSVDWTRLTHAYGPAHDVPVLIRGLCAPDPQERDRALCGLYGTVFHQGTRYEATAPAVPFLLEIVADPGTPADRGAVLRLLTHLAVGYEEHHLPSGYPVAEHRAAAEGGEAVLAAGRAFGPDRAGGAAAGASAAGVPQTGTDRDGEEDEEERDSEEDDGGEGEDQDEWAPLFADRRAVGPGDADRLDAYVTLAAYDAVRAGLPLVRSLLADTGAGTGIRRAAAHALAWFPEEAEAGLPVLVTASADTDPALAATALTAIGLVRDADGADVPSDVRAALEAGLGDPRDVVRWGAAVALLRLDGPAAGPRVTGELLGWLGGDRGPVEEIPFYEGDLRGYTAQALSALGQSGSDDVFAELLGGLVRVSGTEALTVAEAALRLAFPEGPVPQGTPFTALDDRQRRLARVLADSPGAWHYGDRLFGNFTLLLREYALPVSAREMAAYVSADAP